MTFSVENMKGVTCLLFEFCEFIEFRSEVSFWMHSLRAEFEA